MNVRLHDGYGRYTDHQLKAIRIFPTLIFWQGFLYLHHGDGQYWSTGFYQIPEN